MPVCRAEVPHAVLPVLMLALGCSAISGDAPAVSASGITALRLVPSEVILSPSEVEQFGVVAEWDDGATSQPSLVFSSTGGAVSSGGLFIAGAKSGTFRVIARDRTGRLADTSLVTVTPARSGANPHEPSGMTEGFNEPFSDSPVGQPVTGWYVESGESSVSVVDDPTAPVSGPSVLQLKFPAGFGGGNAPMRINWNEPGGFPTNSGTLYLHLRVKISSDWSNNGNVATKFIWPRQSETTNHFVPLTWYGDDLRLGFNLQAAYLHGVDHDYIQDGSSSTGVWHDVELLLFQGSSGSANNGTAKIWVDGALVLNKPRVKFLPNGEAPRWSYITINPTFGGGTNPVPHDQYIWIDHFYASVR